MSMMRIAFLVLSLSLCAVLLGVSGLPVELYAPNTRRSLESRRVGRRIEFPPISSVPESNFASRYRDSEVSPSVSRSGLVDYAPTYRSAASPAKIPPSRSTRHFYAKLRTIESHGNEIRDLVRNLEDDLRVKSFPVDMTERTLFVNQLDIQANAARLLGSLISVVPQIYSDIDWFLMNVQREKSVHASASQQQTRRHHTHHRHRSTRRHSLDSQMDLPLMQTIVKRISGRWEWITGISAEVVERMQPYTAAIQAALLYQQAQMENTPQSSALFSIQESNPFIANFGEQLDSAEENRERDAYDGSNQHVELATPPKNSMFRRVLDKFSCLGLDGVKTKHTEEEWHSCNEIFLNNIHTPIGPPVDPIWTEHLEKISADRTQFEKAYTDWLSALDVLNRDMSRQSVRHSSMSEFLTAQDDALKLLNWFGNLSLRLWPLAVNQE